MSCFCFFSAESNISLQLSAVLSSLLRTQKLPRKPLALCRGFTSAKVGGKRTDKKKKVPSIPFWRIGGISFVFWVDSLGDSYLNFSIFEAPFILQLDFAYFSEINSVSNFIAIFLYSAQHCGAWGFSGSQSAYFVFLK